MTDKSRPRAMLGYEEEFRTIGEILERDAEEIMERWFQVITAELAESDPGTRVEVMNELRHLLQTLGRRLQQQSEAALEIAREASREHGEQRSEIGWNMLELVKDYEVLHSVALEHLGRRLDERLTYRQARVLGTVIDTAIGTAAERFGQLANQKLHSELRRLTLELTDAQHQERRQIAKLLHDDLQQMLVAAQWKLDHAPDAEIRQLLQQTLQLSRNLTTDLYPVAFEHGDLAAATEWLASIFQQRHGLTVTTQLQVPSDLVPVSLRRLLYDAIRELLFNVVKHANTDQAWLRIDCADKSLHIEVEDRGVGAEKITRCREATFGLSSVRHRIERIGGALHIHSKPGAGTRIVLAVPLD